MTTISRKLFALALILTFALAGVVSTASAGVDAVIANMGDLERWAVFSLGGGVSSDSLSGATISGDFGASGTGGVSLASVTLDGNLYYDSQRTLTMGGATTITGATINNQDAMLDNMAATARAASAAAAALTATQSITKVKLATSKTQSIVGAPGATVVLNLRKFQLSGGSTFTLAGTAATNFVINVKKQFSLAGTSSIVLFGGLTWNNVLFNVTGTGSDVRIAGQSNFQGILMATQRNVWMAGQAMVRGEIIANRVSLTQASQVIHPPVVSP